MKLNVNLIKFLCLLGAALTLNGCASRTKKTQQELKTRVSEPQRLFGRGVEAYNAKKFEASADLFTEYLKKFPNSGNDHKANFYLGASFQELSLCPKATPYLKRVVDYGLQTVNYWSTMALYKMGQCYEITKQKSQALASYLDAYSRRFVLTEEQADLELPSKIAMLYLDLGSPQLASRYFERANNYVNRISRNPKAFEDRAKEVSKTLYEIGMALTDLISKNVRTISAMDSVEKYLLLAVEIEVDPWAMKAAEEIENLYQVSYQKIIDLKPNSGVDVELAKRRLQEKQKKLAQELLQKIENLSFRIIPEDKNENARMQILASGLERIKKNLTKLIAQRPVGEGLTPESQKFDSLKREGQIVDDNSNE